MAFVSQTTRKLSQIQRTTNPLGPGQYFKDQTISLRKNPAPFKSTSQRKSILQPNKYIHPGPGNYQIIQPLIQPNVKTVTNTQSIIVKINSTGTPQFKSTVERFNHQKLDNPGPGQYSFNGMSNAVNRRSQSLSLMNELRQTKRSNDATNYLKHKKNYPTIPQKVRGLTDSKQQQQIPNNNIGPGCYNPKKIQKINSRSTVWGKDKSRRFSLDNHNDLGPGKYTPQLYNNQGTDIKQPNFHFKSNTVRTYFDSLIYQTNVDQTAKIRDIDHYKSNDPAPGQYQPNYSSLKVQQKPFEFQFFGSTVQRFPDPQQSKISKSFYNIKSPIGQNRSFNKIQHPFLFDSERKPQFLHLKQTQKIPGPGSYQQKIISQKKYEVNKIQKFGSNSDRMFQKQDQINQIGPGKYTKDISDQDYIYNIKYGNQFNQLTCKFKSGSDRKCFGENKQSQANPFIQYDITRNDISKKVQKQKNFIQNLKKIQVQKPPFQSNNSRFPHYDKKIKINKKLILQQTRIQQLKIIQQQNKKRQIILQANLAQCKSGKKNYFGISQRFQNRDKNMPAVGQYSLRTTWEKKSHNIKFCHL